MTGPHHTLTEPASDAAIDTGCRVLRLPTMRAQFADTVNRAEREHLSYRGFLAELLMAECEDRDRRRSERRIRAASFPRSKWLSDFDYSANPNVTPALVLDSSFSGYKSWWRGKSGTRGRVLDGGVTGTAEP